LDQKKKRFTYSAYGLVISSEIEIQEFTRCEEPADVHIKYDIIQDSTFRIIRKEKNRISAFEFVFITNDAKYSITHGNAILIEARKRANQNIMKAYITGACLAVVLLQRGAVPLHGSSVVIDGKGIIFTGKSGAGKSSLCHTFRKNNYQFLSDDISVVSTGDNGEALVHPAFPQQKLCKDTAKLVGYDLYGSSGTIVDRKLVINSDHNFRNEPAHLAAVFELVKSKNKQVEVQLITGSEKLKRLINNINYISVLTRMGISAEYFMKCTDIAGKIAYYELRRPRRGNTTQEQMNHVIESVSATGSGDI
jgi:GTPase SAR1 family protein